MMYRPGDLVTFRLDGHAPMAGVVRAVHDAGRLVEVASDWCGPYRLSPEQVERRDDPYGDVRPWLRLPRTL